MHHDDDPDYEGPPDDVERYYWQEKRWREEQGK